LPHFNDFNDFNAFNEHSVSTTSTVLTHLTRAKPVLTKAFMRKVIFFDRDGIVNYPPEPGGYVQRPEDFRVMPAFIDSLRICKELGYDAIIITNQQGVGKGLYTEETLGKIHELLLKEVRAEGLDLLDIYYCPHLAAENCTCRKPLPGMILEAAEKWDVDLAHSIMVGDSFRDIDCGLAAGCRTLLVNAARHDKTTAWIQDIKEMPSAIEQMCRK
jgi:D-glycero-D-manno-heptose 1,7-bisphosphate phosphatase